MRLIDRNAPWFSLNASYTHPNLTLDEKQAALVAIANSATTKYSPSIWWRNCEM
jgi:hypothetical protein